MTSKHWRASGLLLALASVAIVGTAAPIEAEPDAITVTYSFLPPTIERIGPFDRVGIPGLEGDVLPGAPVLPMRPAIILLPQGTSPDEVTVTGFDQVILERTYLIEPGQALVPTNSEPKPTPPDPETYASTAPFPGELYTQVDVQALKGYTLLRLKLYPVQYVPATGQISYYRRLEVQVTATPRLTASSTDRMLRPVGEDATRLKRLVDNPALVDTYIPARRSLNFQGPTASLVDPADPYEYVLITNGALSSAFQPLVDWKNSRGVRAALFATEDIYASYGGTDDAERIRSFIVDAYTTWASSDHPLEYVALGGDDEIVPARYVYAPGSGEPYNNGLMPTDMYYAGLDGDWDADGDGQYGENAWDGTLGEEADFFAEVYVGRIPVDTVAQASNVVDKTIRYEQNPDADYLNRAVLIGNQLDDITWGGNGKDTVAALIPQFNVTRLYERDGTYSQSQVIAALNAGTHLANYDGHGNWSCCPLSGYQIDSLTNDEPFLFYSLGCYNGAFDQPTSGDSEAVAEHYVFGEHGAFAYIGNTRYGWYSPGSTMGPGEVLDRLFFDTLVNGGVPNVGRALQEAKEAYTTSDRFSILTLTLFGDPETPIAATAFSSPTALITSPAGSSTLRGIVDIAGTAEAGAAIGASFDSYVAAYGAGVEPSSWNQIGSGSSPVSNGTLATWDTTTVPDGLYIIQLEADDGSGRIGKDSAVVTVDNVTISYPAAGQFLKAGEAVTVTGSAYGSDLQYYRLEYGPGREPSSWTVIGTYTDPVSDGVLGVWDTSAITEADWYTLRLVLVGTEHIATERASIHIDPNLQAGWPQSTGFRFITPMAIGDVSGDGDAEVVATASRINSFSAVHVWRDDGTPVAGWPKSATGYRATAPALADLDRDGTSEIIVATDYGYLYAWHHDGTSVAGWPMITGTPVLIAPVIGDLDADGTLEIIIANQTGDLLVLNHDATPAPGWPKTGVVSGRLSPALGDIDGDGDLEIVAGGSDGTLYVWHHDGTAVSGWPAAASPGIGLKSPVLGDLDDDGDLEIVVGNANDSIYAWHHDGSPLSGWPQATSGLSMGAPALGDLDRDGDLEIVAGSFYQIHAWHHDGSPVAGWPTQVTADYYGTEYSPVLGDIDGDGDVEVIVGPDTWVVGPDDGCTLYALHHDGSPVAGWHKTVPCFQGSGWCLATWSSPVLADVDQDGDVEIAIGVEDQALIWDLEGAYDAETIEWGTYHHDNWHTRNHAHSDPNLPPFVVRVEARPGWVAPGGIVTVTADVRDEDTITVVAVEIEGPDETLRGILSLYDDGAHGDGPAGDGIYGNTWTTPMDKRDYLVDLVVMDTVNNPVSHDNMASFTTSDVPYVQYHGLTITLESETDDGAPNPGESVWFSVELENIGTLDATDVWAAVSTADPCAAPWGGTSTGSAQAHFGDIAAGATGTATDSAQAYGFSFGQSCPHGHDVTFDLTIEDSADNTWHDSFELTIIDNVPPSVWYADVNPGYTPVGEAVSLEAYVQDGSGVTTVEAEIESPDEMVIAVVPLYDDGTHGDQIPLDGIFGAEWITDLTPRMYTVDLAVSDTVPNAATYDHVAQFTTVPFSKTADILIVPDNGQYTTEWIQPTYTNMMDTLGRGYDVWETDLRGAPNSDILNQYTDDIVFWATPTWSSYLVVPGTQASLIDYLEAGGRLFLVGPTSPQLLDGSTLLSEYIHADRVQANLNLNPIAGVTDDAIGDGLVLDISGAGGPAQSEIDPIGPAKTILTYTPGDPWQVLSSGSAGIRVSTGGYKVVFLGFDPAIIHGVDNRAVLMARALDWLMEEHLVYMPLVLNGQ